MTRYHILKDGQIQGSTETRDQAVDMIKAYMKMETHPILRAEFTIIKGEEETIGYSILRNAERI